MSYSDKNTVGDFVFDDPELLKQAKKESEAVEYIKAKMDFSKPATVLAVYNKMIDKNMLNTAIGLTYLKELNDFLKNADGIDTGAIRKIPVTEHTVIKESFKEDITTKKDKQRLKDRLRLSFIINLLLVIVVISLFAIQLSATNPNIVNFEDEIVNKYSGWQQDLNDKESSLNERERIIMEKEESLGISSQN